MTIADKISSILAEKGLTKKFFAQKLVELEPTLKSTGEAPSISSIYGYLNGSREIKAELIPYIAEVLGVSVAELFDTEAKESRYKTLQEILKSPTKEEQKALENWFRFEEALTREKLASTTNRWLYSHICESLPFASSSFLHKLVDILDGFRDLTNAAETELGS